MNTFRRRRIAEELDEELASHLDEALEHGRSVEDARRAFGATLLHRETSREVKLLPWLDALASDIVFGWRQLNKHRAVSIAAILSLALSIGATTAAFRLVDAVLLRTLPVNDPQGLYFLTTSNIDRDGRTGHSEYFDYSTFREYSKAAGDNADLMVIGMSSRQDAIVDTGQGTEKLYRQYLSGNVFAVFGLQPALGRLLTVNDDLKPGAHPVAVLSHDYWRRRFGGDRKVIGKSFRLGSTRYEIVGVASEGFIGTEPGVVTDVFIPAMMNVQALNSPDWSWFRIWMRPKPGVSPEQVRQPVQAVLTQELRERVKNLHPDTPKQVLNNVLSQAITLHPAASGVSELQKVYRRPLLILAVLVVLVLMIACVNVANLLTAQATARAREMALRVSIGAGRFRLIQLVMVESALLAVAASITGALIAWWSAPFVVSMLAPPEDPVRLILDADWRSISFGVGLTVAVMFLFGLAPALRASSIQPISALKGGEDPHSRGRLMNPLIAAQMAFCVLVLFVAELFMITFERLSNRTLGFQHERVLALEIEGSAQHAPETWMQVADQLERTSGVESVALSGWALLTDNRWMGPVQVAGRLLEPVSPYFLNVSPGFFETMRIELIGGRDFRLGDLPPRMGGDNKASAGVGIVNEAFARTYFNGQNPLGRPVQVPQGKDISAGMEIVGYVRDARYGDLREPIRPTVYVPIHSRSGGTLVVRTAGNPLALATTLRREVSRAHPDLRVTNVATQTSLVRRHLIRERLLAMLSLYFAALALVLAAIGLYGLFNYSVIQQRREIGVRMALGARTLHVVRRVTAQTLGLVCIGCAGGIAAGLACEAFLSILLFDVKATDLSMLAAPILILAAAAFLAALPPAIRAARIDPAETLRSL
jgi:predicted permease